MGKPLDKFKVVISDCHLSAGRYFEGRLNPHEDFIFDDEMCDFFKHFSSGEFGEQDGVPVEVELIINGDFFDFLNVPYHGEFEDAISEEISEYKVKACLAGHPKVMKALREFASKPGKKITYLVGNHDHELFFEKVRDEIVRVWDPQGKVPSPTVRLIHDRDRITYAEGVEIRHGNQLETGNELDFEQPFIQGADGRKYLNLPWGTIYILKIVNRLKWEREFLDKVRPIQVYVLFGLILDFRFTIKFVFLSTYYFFKTRIRAAIRRWWHFSKLKEILRVETRLFLDLERQARHILDESPHVQTVIFGHTHKPMNKLYPDGKQYINTGTWTKMIDLDLRSWGNTGRKTFAFIRIRDGKAECELRHWIGSHGPHQMFNG